jgi:hypothetical protein
LDDYISIIQAYVSLGPTELIVNLHETGLSDWEERKAKPMIIPSEATQIPLPDPADRNIRHHTLLCCVSASGDAYTPLFIASRPNTTGIFGKASATESISNWESVALLILMPIYSTSTSRKHFSRLLRQIVSCQGVLSNRRFYSAAVAQLIVLGHSERTGGEWSASADASAAHVAHISGARPSIIRDFGEIQKIPAEK